jgi:hypothetical protein
MHKIIHTIHKNESLSGFFEAVQLFFIFIDESARKIIGML